MGILLQKIKIDVEKKVNDICNFIRNSVKEFRSDGAIVGISGGIDSACVSGLLSLALGSERVFGLIMPEKDSSDETKSDAELVANTFNIKTKFIDITNIVDAFGAYSLLPKNIFAKKEIASRIIKFAYSLFPKNNSPFIGNLLGTKFKWQQKAQAYYRIKHRIRMVNLYLYGEQMNYIVAGTANKTELLTGFFVKYGDSAADIMPIINLYKTQVKEISKYIGVPEKIINKKPTPDLIPGIEDEMAIGLSYDVLDLILVGLTNGIDERKIAEELDISLNKVEYVKKIMELSRFMREPPLSV